MPTKKLVTQKSKKVKRPSKSIQAASMYIAMVIRNAMEDFHVKYLSDKHMKELNPIIRDAVCTALFALDNSERSIAAREFVDFNVILIPEYWEPPKLTKDFLELERWHKPSTRARKPRPVKQKKRKTS